jgi:hypothetical protein
MAGCAGTVAGARRVSLWNRPHSYADMQMSLLGPECARRAPGATYACPGATRAGRLSGNARFVRRKSSHGRSRGGRGRRTVNYMPRTDDFRMAPGDGLRYYAPESDRDRHDKESGYVVLLVLVVLVLVAMATGQVTVFYY